MEEAAAAEISVALHAAGAEPGDDGRGASRRESCSVQEGLGVSEATVDAEGAAAAADEPHAAEALEVEDSVASVAVEHAFEAGGRSWCWRRRRWRQPTLWLSLQRGLGLRHRKTAACFPPFCCIRPPRGTASPCGALSRGA